MQQRSGVLQSLNGILTTYQRKTLEGCLENLESVIGRKMLDPNSTDPDRGEENAITFFTSTGTDFKDWITAYGIMVHFGEYSRARNYINSLQTQTTEQANFLIVQNINLDYLANPASYVVDSNLYISFYERYLKSGPSQDYLEMRKVLYGFDKDYNIIFNWIGPDFETQESLSYLTISQDTTIYINFKRIYQTSLAALRPDGSTKWECLIDSTILLNLYNIRKIILADNGDIIGTGVISSVIDELGESGFLFRIDSPGNLKWKRAIRVNKGFDLTVPEIFPYQTGLEDLIELPGGDLLATGYVRRFLDEDPPDGPYNFDIWMVRTNAEGCLWEDCPYIQDIVTRPNYIPLVSSKNEWVVDVYSDFAPDRIVRNTFYEDSTLIDGEYYFQLLYSSDMSGPWETTGQYFREENGKVFTIGSETGQTKKLIYDFDFIIGDTLLSHDDGFPNQRKIVQVGGIQLMDSVQRKFLTLQCSTDMVNDSTTWIEGMGDVEQRFWTLSFCSANDGHGSYTSIRCFSTDGQLLYLRPDLEGCYTTAIENIESESLHIFPNPNSGNLQFETIDEFRMKKIAIYDQRWKAGISF